MYTGVPLKVLLDEAGLKPNAKWLLLEGGDAAAMTRSLPLAKALDDVLVAYRMNGEMLYPENGYPVRMVLPGWEANMWVKWLRRIEVGDAALAARARRPRNTPTCSRTARRGASPIVMDAKSVITNPSPQAPINHKIRLHGAVGPRLVRTRQDRPRRCLARWRPQLAQRQASTDRSGTRR